MNVDLCQADRKHVKLSWHIFAITQSYGVFISLTYFADIKFNVSLKPGAFKFIATPLFANYLFYYASHPTFFIVQNQSC